MKKLLLLWLMMAPMSGMAQNESTPQDTTLYVNGRKIVIKEQGDGKPHRTERPPLLQKEQQEKQI